MKNLSIIIIIFMASIITACNSDSNVVVVYTSVDQVFSEPVLKAFEKETGIKIKAIYDTEETKSTGVLNRLLAERNNTQCDVFWSGDPVRTIVLKNYDIIQPYNSEMAKGIDATFKDADAYWTGFSARARVLIYNKDILSRADVPQSIFDLVKEQYKGNVAIANPLFGTTTFHISAIFDALGDDRAKQFMMDLKTNEVIIATSNGDVKKRVMQGQVACGLTDTDDAYEAMKESDRVDIVFLDQGGIGSLIMPNTVNLMKNSPNAENGKKLIDYLLSKDTESRLAISCAQMPLHKGVETPQDVTSLDNIKPMSIDYGKTANKLQEIQLYLKNWVENN